MAPFGPFERRPVVAVAVSGGADSMGAAVLVHDWANALSGRAIAVVVDHGLRPESSDEAALVRRRLSEMGIESVALSWTGEKPSSNLQSAARQARYRLLAEYCAEQGILNLVLGHHQEDQAETFLMRLSRGSGLYGLAAMTLLQEQPDYRVLRPLLTLPKARLVRTLEMRGIEWVEDPSNRNLKYERTRFRTLLPALAPEGLPASKLAETAQRLGEARTGAEAAVSRALARSVSVHPAGIALVDPAPLQALPKDIALRCLARILTTFSGGDYGPRLERLDSLYGKISAGLTTGATLSGCRLLPWRQNLVICRENRHLAPVLLQPGCLLHWDGRFDVIVSVNFSTVSGDLTIGPLGRDGWSAIRRSVQPENLGFPPLAGDAVPAFWDDKGVASAPHLGYFRQGVHRALIEKCRFRSRNSLTGVAFTVA